MFFLKSAILELSLSPSASHATSSAPPVRSATFNASISARFVMAESSFSASSTCQYPAIPAVVRNDSLFFAEAVFR